MMIKKGSTDVTLYVFLGDSADGTPETALTITTLDITYIRNRAAAVKADATALSTVTDAHTDNAAIEVDATNAPGIYRVDFPDAAFATGVDKVILAVTATGVAPSYFVVDLVEVDTQSTGWTGFDQAIRSIIVGTVGSGSTTTSIVTSAITPAAGAIDCFKGLILKFDQNTTTAALRGQGTDITANTAGATPTLTVTALTTAPVSGDVFSIE